MRPTVVVVMGVSGTGKSTVAGLLAGRLGWDLAEGDEMHPAANVAKMSSGRPLDDEDRWPWLGVIAAWIRHHLDARTPGVVTCSALRRSYRDVLRAPGVVFVQLDGTFDQIAALLAGRHGHFMPSSLLASQLNSLEPLEPDEEGIVETIGGAPEDEVADIVQRLGLQERPADDDVVPAPG